MATPVWQLTNPDTDTQESMFDDASSFSADEMHHEAREVSSHAVPEATTREHAHSAETESHPPAVLTADEFAGLEDRILRAVNLVRRERQARIAAEERAAALQAQVEAAEGRSASIETLQQENAALRAEREQVRTRVDRLLTQLDALEL
jgi:hypothetical protein